jgi:flavin-dependent dehydrogenase
MNTKCEQFDVVLIGAGPAGAATAYWLAADGKQVALIEKSRFDEARVGESVPPAIQLLLHELGLWPAFLATHPLPSHGTRSYWGDATPLEHSHVINPWGNGWHVDRLSFDRMLVDAAVNAGVLLYLGESCRHCVETAAGWLLQLHATDSPSPITRELQTRVLIDATGRSARVARMIGAQRMLLDRLVGVAACYAGVHSEQQGYVMVESTADGWWYSAPLPYDAMMVMAMTDSDLCGKLRYHAIPTWRSHLHDAPMTRQRIDNGHAQWGPCVYSAYSHRLRRARHGNHHWLAVGDAALAVDPISGSGVIRALRSARAGAHTALAMLARPHHTGEAIEIYETKCDMQCTTYLHERAMYYGLEQRWRQHAFWERRNVL